MPHYLVQVSYTSETWANMIAHPHDRVEAVRPTIENMGGKIHHAFFSFGEYDLVAIVEMPGNVEAASFALAASGGGALKNMKTTPLLTAAEGLEALKGASKTGYKPHTAHA